MPYNERLGHSHSGSMQKPDPQDGVACPDATNKESLHTPTKVFTSRKPDGTVVKQGVLDKHTHRRDWHAEECPWSGLPVPVQRKPTTDMVIHRCDALAVVRCGKDVSLVCQRDVPPSAVFYGYSDTGWPVYNC